MQVIRPTFGHDASAERVTRGRPADSRGRGRKKERCQRNESGRTRLARTDGRNGHILSQCQYHRHQPRPQHRVRSMDRVDPCRHGCSRWRWRNDEPDQRRVSDRTRLARSHGGKGLPQSRSLTNADRRPRQHRLIVLVRAVPYWHGCFGRAWGNAAVGTAHVMTPVTCRNPMPSSG